MTAIGTMRRIKIIMKLLTNVVSKAKYDSYGGFLVVRRAATKA